MFVATKVMHEREHDSDDIDFHFEEEEGRSIVCEANQVPNAPFSEDPALNNRPNIALLAKLMAKRATIEDLAIVQKYKLKNAVTASAEASTVPAKRKVQEMNTESSPSLSSEVLVNPSPSCSSVSGAGPAPVNAMPTQHQTRKNNIGNQGS
jgi:hypothetical protein